MRPRACYAIFGGGGQNDRNLLLYLASISSFHLGGIVRLTPAVRGLVRTCCNDEMILLCIALCFTVTYSVNVFDVYRLKYSIVTIIF